MSTFGSPISVATWIIIGSPSHKSCRQQNLLRQGTKICFQHSLPNFPWSGSTRLPPLHRVPCGSWRGTVPELKIMIRDHWSLDRWSILILWRSHYVYKYLCHLCVYFAVFLYILDQEPSQVRNCCAVLWAKRAHNNLSSWRWRAVLGEVCKSRVTRQGSKMNELPLEYVTCEIGTCTIKIALTVCKAATTYLIWRYMKHIILTLLCMQIPSLYM